MSVPLKQLFLKAEEGGDAVASVTDDNEEDNCFRGADIKVSGVTEYWFSDRFLKEPVPVSFFHCGIP